METPDFKGLYLKVKTDKKTKTLVAAVFCSLVVLALFATLYSRSVLEVSVNGEKLGNVNNNQILTAIKKELKEEYKNKLGADVEFVQDIKAVLVRAWGQKLDTEDDA